MQGGDSFVSINTVPASSRVLPAAGENLSAVSATAVKALSYGARLVSIEVARILGGGCKTPRWPNN